MPCFPFDAYTAVLVGSSGFRDLYKRCITKHSLGWTVTDRFLNSQQEKLSNIRVANQKLKQAISIIKCTSFNVKRGRSLNSPRCLIHTQWENGMCMILQQVPYRRIGCQARCSRYLMKVILVLQRHNKLYLSIPNVEKKRSSLIINYPIIIQHKHCTSQIMTP